MRATTQCHNREPTALLTFVAHLFFFVVLAGCQSHSLLDFTMTASDASDKTLVVSGCEGSLGRGFMSCRFVAGAPYGEEGIKIIVPWSSDSKSSSVRVRSGARVVSMNSTGAEAKVKYSEIFEGGVFKITDDGPIQVAVSTRMADGSIIQTLGYVYLVVLNRGYNPKPWQRITRCDVSYDELGRSEADCDE